MRVFVVFIIILGFASCDYFDKKKVSAEDLLNEELESFNWNEVDEFPSFAHCDSTALKPDRRICFESTLTQSVSTYLSNTTFVVSEALNDTVFMTFQVSETGQLKVLDVTISEEVSEQIPELDSILKHSVLELPKIYPAIKRGQQVKTEFKIPILIQSH